MDDKAWIWLGLVSLAALAGGGYVAVTAYDRRAFLTLVRDEVRRHLDELRPDIAPAARLRAAQIVAAQAGLESGYGVTRQFRDGWNFGNVSKGSWTGPTIAGGDTEYDAAGNVTRIRQEWRSYSSLAAAVSDFFGLLAWARYRPARDALMAGDAAGYAAALRDGGYFTAPLAEYRAGLIAALAKVEAVS